MSDLTVPPLQQVVADLRRGAEECAREGVAGWGNTMTDAAEAIASLLRAVPPLPVVAERWRFTTAKDQTWRHCESVPNFDPSIVEADPLVRKADADAALASLQARLEAAERDRDEFLRALEVIGVGDSADPVRDAGDELVAMGYWRKEALDGMRAATSQEGK
jgi:hypothetical protein